MKSSTLSLVVLLGAATTVFPGSGWAEGPKSKPAASSKTLAPDQVPLPPDVLSRLNSGDEAQIRTALDDARASGRGAVAAVPAITGILTKRGLSAPLAEAALDTLGDIEAESSSEAIALYAVHRLPAVRRAAIKALTRTRGPKAAKVLRHALSDSDGVVRGAAASGLGAMKATDAVGDLFLALDHRVGEAAASIGQLCKEDECSKLVAKMGVIPYDVLSTGIEQLLFRPTSEVSDDTKVRIIGRVRELGTGEAHRFLLDVQKRWPANASPRVKHAIDQAALATGGGAE